MLHPHCPVKVDALCKNRRRLISFRLLGGRSRVIGGFYAHARASVTVILPPVGSALRPLLRHAWPRMRRFKRMVRFQRQR